jgi:hypothetical protein
VQLRELIENTSDDHLKQLQETLVREDAAQKKAEISRTAAVEQRGSLLLRSKTERLALDQAKADRIRAQALEEDRRALVDYDANIVDELRERLDKTPGGVDRAYVDRLAQCDELLTDYRQRAERALHLAIPAFNSFLDRYAYPLMEERSEWRKAAQWIVKTKDQIVDSTLHQYQPEAERAKQVAEESFRKDIAFKLREGIEKMQANVRAVNKILEKCPPFSNNERYKFVHPVAPAYQDLYRYIIHSADDTANETLFNHDEELSRKIVDLLNAPSHNGAPPVKTPLDDFRLLFNFDLEILEGGEAFSLLSKRMSRGSNGEHLTPFHVIAAAALTHAYRIDSANHGAGAALMLLDEAFGAMDDQNAVATAGFIDRMGLQMIMSAPSADSAKLCAFTHTIYEMDRFGGDLYFHREDIAPEGHELMRSDMPSIHPELVTRRANEIRTNDGSSP